MKWCNFFNKISLILQALGCAVLYFVIEAICRHSFTEAWTYMTTKPLVFAYNAAFIFTTMLIVYLFRKRIFWRIFVGSLWLFLGIVNGVLLLNRVTPFTGPDVKNLTDGLSIAKKYLTHTQMTIGAVLLGIAVLILLIILIRSPKYRGKLKYKVNIPLVLVGVLAFGGITQLALEKRVLSNYFGNIAIMRITDILTVWQRRSLIPESVPREIIPKARSKESRSRKKIFRKRKKAVIRIFCFYSWSPFLILRW